MEAWKVLAGIWAIAGWQKHPFDLTGKSHLQNSQSDPISFNPLEHVGNQWLNWLNISVSCTVHSPRNWFLDEHQNPMEPPFVPAKGRCKSLPFSWAMCSQKSLCRGPCYERSSMLHASPTSDNTSWFVCVILWKRHHSTKTILPYQKTRGTSGGSPLFFRCSTPKDIAQFIACCSGSVLL